MPHHENMQMTTLRGPVSLSHLFLRQFVLPGDCAVDATCGNGSDTLLLAELVGPAGLVWAFDIQAGAIGQTSSRLHASGMGERATLITSSHDTMLQHVDRQVKAVVFNLGYLPGGNRDLITRPETTLAALDQSLKLLLTGGILAVTVYPGHSGGNDERRAVESWSRGLTQKQFHVWRMGQINVANAAPYLILFQKAA